MGPVPGFVFHGLAALHPVAQVVPALPPLLHQLGLPEHTQDSRRIPGPFRIEGKVNTAHPVIRHIEKSQSYQISIQTVLGLQGGNRRAVEKGFFEMLPVLFTLELSFGMVTVHSPRLIRSPGFNSFHNNLLPPGYHTPLTAGGFELMGINPYRFALTAAGASGTKEILPEAAPAGIEKNPEFKLIQFIGEEIILNKDLFREVGTLHRSGGKGLG